MRIDFHAILPELVLAGTAVLVLVVDLFLKRAKVVANYLALAGTVAAGVALATLVPGGTRSTFGGSPSRIHTTCWRVRPCRSSQRSIALSSSRDDSSGNNSL